MGEIFAGWARRYMPDPFIFAILLTLVTLLFGVAFTKSGMFDMVGYWAKGFWDLLKFGMQMCLILMTGWALASSGPVRRMIDKVAALPSGPASGAALVAFMAGLMALINWGLGLIVGAFLAREVGRSASRRGVKMHYPLIGAAGYIGLLVWHSGFSGSIPLTVASDDPGTNFLIESIGVIPISRTIFSPLNIALSLVLLAVLPVMVALMAPSEDQSQGFDAFVKGADQSEGAEEERTEEDDPASRRFSYRLENSRILSLLIGLMGMSYVVYYFHQNGFSRLSVNIVNFTFLFIGILLHGTPIRYVGAINEAVRGCAGIILQFPFYAGIMGMIKFSGLVGVFAGWVVSISNEVTYPIFTFLSAGVVNMFVPSGGGQWAVQGPVAIEAARNLGVSFPKALLAVSYGDEWTNLLQPFWALPLLGITGLKARDIMGYTMTIMLLVMPIFCMALILLPAL